ncbi:hypothetical protein NPIL_538251 [Nephila pilipes]|uniref:Uncharacterized protein n=1 Tax=Nephila pilipes TaxID=299642 RepID=A0A8X6PYG9_NEPPI|nr:hypothetical protein NPIL_538251 [Nephila pilipes]
MAGEKAAASGRVFEGEVGEGYGIAGSEKVKGSRPAADGSVASTRCIARQRVLLRKLVYFFMSNCIRKKPFSKEHMHHIKKLRLEMEL